MNLADIKQLFEYTEWANDRAMHAAAKLPDENLRRDVGMSHRSIFGTLLHMAGAEWIWLERWNGRSPAKDQAWSLWTTESCADLAMLKERWGDVVARRSSYVSELNESGLAAELPFRLLSGDPSSMRLVDQMHHLITKIAAGTVCRLGRRFCVSLAAHQMIRPDVQLCTVRLDTLRHIWQTSLAARPDVHGR